MGEPDDEDLEDLQGLEPDDLTPRAPVGRQHEEPERERRADPSEGEAGGEGQTEHDHDDEEQHDGGVG